MVTLDRPRHRGFCGGPEAVPNCNTRGNKRSIENFVVDDRRGRAHPTRKAVNYDHKKARHAKAPGKVYRTGCRRQTPGTHFRL